ncbi:MAG: hypothetical protein JRN68_09590 [Nitrososphaerota archaeon]|nr:hypothetical protein [Ferrimicrobium acidiphilum]MDG6934933.1 hypothetical protein [Nitrososphaerota archaeon]
MAGKEEAKKDTGEELTRTSLRLPTALFKKVGHYAVDHDVDNQDVYVMALNQFLAREEKKQ